MQGVSRGVLGRGAGAKARGRAGGAELRGGPVPLGAGPVARGPGAVPAHPHVRVTRAGAGAGAGSAAERSGGSGGAMQPPAASPGPAAPAGAELLRWQWREVQAPCLVAAWILVASLAKIGECPRVPTRSGPPAADVPTPGRAGGMRHPRRARGHPG